MLLRKAGYRTGFIGKYGVKTEGKPEAEMFDLFEPHDRLPLLLLLEICFLGEVIEGAFMVPA